MAYLFGVSALAHCKYDRPANHPHQDVKLPVFNANISFTLGDRSSAGYGSARVRRRQIFVQYWVGGSLSLTNQDSYLVKEGSRQGLKI